MSDCGNIDSNIDIDDDGQVCRQTQTDDDNGPGANDNVMIMMIIKIMMPNTISGLRRTDRLSSAWKD